MYAMCLTYADDHLEELCVDAHSLARKQGVHERHNVVSPTTENHEDLLERSRSNFERAIEVHLRRNVQELPDRLAAKHDHSKLGLSLSVESTQSCLSGSSEPLSHSKNNSSWPLEALKRVY